MTVDDILDEFFRREGWPKVTDRPSDLGRLTKGGITYVNYNRWRAKHRERALTPEEFVAITDPEARVFLEDEFVRPFLFVADDRIRLLLIDWAAHAGPDDPTKALQRLLSLHRLYAGAIDGIPGPKTRAGWEQFVAQTPDLLSTFVVLVCWRQSFHEGRAFDAAVKAFLKANPETQLHNLPGWNNRTREFFGLIA